VRFDHLMPLLQRSPCSCCIQGGCSSMEHSSTRAKTAEKGKSSILHSKLVESCIAPAVLVLVEMTQNASQRPKHCPSQTIWQRKALVNFCICPSNVIPSEHCIMHSSKQISDVSLLTFVLISLKFSLTVCGF